MNRNKGVYRYGCHPVFVQTRRYEIRTKRRYQRIFRRSRKIEIASWNEPTGSVVLCRRDEDAPLKIEKMRFIGEVDSTELIENHTWVSFGGPMVKVE